MFAWRHPILKTPNLGRSRARSVLFDLKDTRDLINSLVMDRYATAFRLPPMARKLLGSGEAPSLRVTPVGDLMCWGEETSLSAAKEETAHKHPEVTTGLLLATWLLEDR